LESSCVHAEEDVNESMSCILLETSELSLKVKFSSEPRSAWRESESIVSTPIVLHF
jgi:hypothetical protein